VVITKSPPFIFIERWIKMNEDILRDLYERMGRLEAKIDDVRSIRETADSAYRLAEKAMVKAEDNENDINKLSSTLKWTTGTILTVLVPLVLFVLGKIFN
jgi:Haemolysin XhlA